jgi:hypothetical protein
MQKRMTVKYQENSKGRRKENKKRIRNKNIIKKGENRIKM